MMGLWDQAFFSWGWCLRLLRPLHLLLCCLFVFSFLFILLVTKRLCIWLGFSGIFKLFHCLSLVDGVSWMEKYVYILYHCSLSYGTFAWTSTIIRGRKSTELQLRGFCQRDLFRLRKPYGIHIREHIASKSGIWVNNRICQLLRRGRPYGGTARKQRYFWTGNSGS